MSKPITRTLRIILQTLVVAIFMVSQTIYSAEQQPNESRLQQLRQADQELNAVFKEALSRLGEKEKQALRKDQRVWIKERDQKCGTDLQGTSYEDWLSNVAKDFDRKQCVVELSNTRSHQIREKYFNSSQLCKKIALLIDNKTVNYYVPESKTFEPRGSEYLNLDIDGDGKPDKVTVESASEGSSLDIILSNGGEYYIEENGYILLIKLVNRVYALVTYWKWTQNHDGSNDGKIASRSLYQLNDKKPEIICDKFMRR